MLAVLVSKLTWDISTGFGVALTPHVESARRNVLISRNKNKTLLEVFCHNQGQTQEVGGLAAVFTRANTDWFILHRKQSSIFPYSSDTP